MPHLNREAFDDPAWSIVVDGEKKRRRGDVQESIIVFDRAIAAFTDFTSAAVRVETYICRGVAHAQDGDEDHAIIDFSEAIRFDLKRSLALFNRACAYERAGQYESAVEDLGCVIELQPDNPDAYVCRGRLLKRMGQQENANKDFAAVRRINNLATER